MTTNQPAVIDRDAFAVRRTIFIAADLERVWDAITKAEHIAGWFGTSAELDTLAVGAKGSVTWDDYGTFALLIEELDAPYVIAYRWSNHNTVAVDPLDPASSTVFRFTLEPVTGGTQLTVVETGFSTLPDPEASLKSNREGWTSELDELVAYVEAMS